MTRSLALRSFLLAGLLASLTLLSGSGQAFTEYHQLHRDFAVGPVCPLGVCFWLDHTWGESEGDGSCTDDMVQSKSAPNAPSTHCYSHNAGNSACSGSRKTSLAQLNYLNGTSSCGSVWGLYGNCYANANNGTYLVNGVCHQATNRAFSRTPVPWIRDVGWFIAGAELSFQFYAHYGEWSPGSGAYWDQGC